MNALIQVAAKQEFTDHGALNAVITKFNDIKNNFYDASGKLAADEEVAEAEFSKFVTDSAETILQSEETISYNNGLIEENI